MYRCIPQSKNKTVLTDDWS